MISDIPSTQDFYDAGHELFDFAWDTVARLWTGLSEAESWGIDKEEVSEDYWGAAQSRLASALAVTQQGTELILKGKIAAITPFLLLADPPSKWPDPTKNARFSDLRTVDAQDLVKLYNSVSANPFSADFSQRFHRLRDSRNRIFHSVDKNLKVTTSEVLETILALYKDLFPDRNWAHMRASFIQNAPDTKLDGGDYSLNNAAREIKVVMDLLSPAAVQHFFGVDKKKRLYLCPHCLDNFNRDIDPGDYPHLAQLKPAAPKSTKIYCPLCDATYEVERVSCTHDECKGNVIDPTEGRCLTCSEWVADA
ncbi:MAG: hypothetical protein V4684_06195 [Pseudomonadota bacterium]